MMFAVARSMNAGRHCTPWSVVNVNFPSNLKRGLLPDGSTSHALRNGELEGIYFNTGRLPVLTSGGIENWVFVRNVLTRRIGRAIVESTTGWIGRVIRELR